MLTLDTHIRGKTTDDLLVALEEVTRLVREGYTSGANSNEDGDHNFEISGDAEESPMDED